MVAERVYVGVWLPKEIVEEIDRIAEREGNPRATVFRRILMRIFRENRDSRR